jgi:hypothetical protein
VQDCLYQYDFFPFYVCTIALLLLPRLALLLPGLALVLLAYTVETAVSGLHPERVDYAADFVVNLAYLVAVTIAAYGAERRERAQFADVVRTQQASRAVAEGGVLVRAILASALPAPLVAAAGVVEHRSGRATIGIAEIADYDAWCTGHLFIDVVHMLHLLLVSHDALVDRSDAVDRVMAYGDTYVVASGLLAPHAEHRAAVLDYAGAQRGHAARMQADGSVDYALRIAVVTGPAAGTTVGAELLRYVVLGPAVDRARELLRECGPQAILTDDMGVADDGSAIGKPPTIRQQTASQVDHASEYDVAASGSDVDPIGSDGSELAFSKLWLTFEVAEMQARHVARRSTGDLNAIVTAVVTSAYVLVVALEQASPTERKQHEQQPAGLALLAVAFVLSWAHTAALHRFNGLDSTRNLPILADAAGVAVTFLCLSIGLILLNCVWAEPTTGYLITAMVRRIDGVQWMKQSAIFFATAAIPALVWFFALAPYPALASPQLPTIIVTLPVAVLYRYVVCRSGCQQFAIAEVAGRCLEAAKRLDDHMTSLLGGLTPLHAAPHIELTVAPLARPRYVSHWQSLTVLQVALQFAADTAVAAVAAAWGHVTNATAVATTSHLLSAVEATGDAFLIAGAFGDASDEQNVAAARSARRLLRAFAGLLDETCAFTAVATAGSAYDCLLGAGCLAFRLAGPAVRENNAILRAAPRPANAAVNVAFASESFRRQERNFVPLTVARDGALSTTLLPGSEQSSAAASPLPRDAPGAFPAAEWRARFAEPGRWRVHGLGSALVSVIHFGE